MRSWWIVQQHDDFKLTESSTRPDSTVEPGERKKRTFGPYASKDAAAKRLEVLEKRTLRVKNGRR